uniref:Uncharacterized protein n=1 Tax=Parascaris univalens TaxID=6257 RepID=A0A915BNF5_PARUN
MLASISETSYDQEVLYRLSGYFIQFKKDVHDVLQKRQPNIMRAVVDIEAWLISLLLILLFLWLAICCMPCICCKFLQCICCGSWDCCKLCCTRKKQKRYRRQGSSSGSEQSASPFDGKSQSWQSYSS